MDKKYLDLLESNIRGQISDLDETQRRINHTLLKMGIYEGVKVEHQGPILEGWQYRVSEIKINNKTRLEDWKERVELYGYHLNHNNTDKLSKFKHIGYLADVKILGDN